jgi:hypothetical protein
MPEREELTPKSQEILDRLDALERRLEPARAGRERER